MVCYCFCTWAVQLIKGIFHFDIFLISWFRIIRVLFFALWILHSWRIWWIRRQRIRRCHGGWLVDVQALLEAFLNMPLRSACCIDKAVFVAKRKPLVLGLLKSWIIRISKLLDVLLNEFCSIIILYHFFFLLFVT